MEAVRIETVEFIRQSVQEEFDMIMEHRGIELKLNELDVLIEEAAAKAQEALREGKRVQHTW
jgi:hypothetical protein